MDKVIRTLLVISAMLHMGYGAFVSTSPTLTLMAFSGGSAMLLILWGVTRKGDN